MSRKKDNERMTTQVLNLNEVRDAEKEDKRKKHQKMPLTLLIIAVILIAIGLLYIPVSTAIKKANEKEDYKVESDPKSTLTCTLTKEDAATRLNTSATIIFNFKDRKLKNYNSVTTIWPIDETAESSASFTAYYNLYTSMSKTYKNVKGYSGKVELQDSKMLLTTKIDFNSLDTSKIKPIDTTVNTSAIIDTNYKLDLSYNKVTTLAKNSGCKCK